MLRILHVAPYSPDAWAYGGIPRIVGTFTRELARQGHDVTLCTTDVCDASSRLTPPSRPSSSADAWRATGGGGVRRLVFRNVSNRLAYHRQLFTPLGLNSYLRQHAGTFDVAHLHACRNLPGAVAAHHLRRAGVPYVIAPHGTAARIERAFLAKRVFDVIYGDTMMRHAACVLAVSGAEQAQLRRMLTPAPIRMLPNPVDLDEFSRPVPRGKFRSRIGLGEAPVVMFLGKMTPRKNVDVLVRAFARVQMPDARLVLAGNDMGGAGIARSVIRSLDLTGQTLFTGLLEGRERLEALADADLVVYPSQDEIFGLVPLEALLCGTPVVVADDSGCGEVINSTGGGQVVRTGDHEALASAITLVLEDPLAWRVRAGAAASSVRARYGADVVTTRLAALYRGLLPQSELYPAASVETRRYVPGSSAT